MSEQPEDGADTTLSMPAAQNRPGRSKAESRPLAEATTGSQQATDDKRRLKKRESDRRCQRVSRDKTRTRITYLEGLINEVKEADASGRMAPLLERISQLQEERDSLTKKLKAIETILSPVKESSTSIQASTSRFPAPTPETPTTAADPPGPPTVSVPQNPVDTPISSGGLSPDQGPHQSERPLPTNLGMPHPTQPLVNSSPLARNICACGYAISVNRLDLSIWHQVNNVLGLWMKWPNRSAQLTEDDHFYYDTPVRAVVEGWDAVERRGNVHPMWRLVRFVDETLFTEANDSLSRLGIIFNVSLVLRAHVDPAEGRFTKLPKFFQEQLGEGVYAYATNFVPWPGIRTALLRNEHRYCGNRFWKTFINCLRTEWPFEFRDCYLYNSRSGLYQVSPYYAETLGDIRRIGVTRDFFDPYPEFRSAIISLDEIPPSLAATFFHPRPVGLYRPAPPSHPPSQPPPAATGNVSSSSYKPAFGSTDTPTKNSHTDPADGNGKNKSASPTEGRSLVNIFDPWTSRHFELLPGEDFPAEAASYISGRDFL